MKRISACALSLALAASLILPAGATGSTFSDVPETHWAYAYVEEVAKDGVVSGVGGGLFGPEETMSTAQFAVMITAAFCPETVNTDTEVGTP